MRHFNSFLTLVAAALVGGCGGSRVSPVAEIPAELPRSTEAVEATPPPNCIDFEHPEASRHPNLVMMVGARLETGTTPGCFQVHSFVETGVATNEGFTPLAVLLERHADDVDAWVFDWTNLRLSPVGTFPNGELVHVEVVDAGRRAILVSTNSVRTRRSVIFVPNRHESSVQQDGYVPASDCLVLQNTAARPWWRTETRLEAETGNLVVDYIGVDAEPFHQESLAWNAEAQRYALPADWLSREESTCFYPGEAAPEAPYSLEEQ